MFDFLTVRFNDEGVIMSDYHHSNTHPKYAHHFKKLENTSYPRVMVSGPCQVIIIQNGHQSSCACSQGLFILETKDRWSDNCVTCDHPLSKHTDAETVCGDQTTSPDKIMPRPLKSRKGLVLF